MLKKPNIKQCDFTEYRNWAMVNFIIATGCRISSVINIKIQELDLDNALVSLSHTKNKSAQILPLPVASIDKSPLLSHDVIPAELENSILDNEPPCIW